MYPSTWHIAIAMLFCAKFLPEIEQVQITNLPSGGRKWAKQAGVGAQDAGQGPPRPDGAARCSAGCTPLQHCTLHCTLHLHAALEICRRAVHKCSAGSGRACSSFLGLEPTELRESRRKSASLQTSSPRFLPFFDSSDLCQLNSSLGGVQTGAALQVGQLQSSLLQPRTKWSQFSFRGR